MLHLPCFRACPSPSSTPSPSSAVLQSPRLRPTHRVWLSTPPPRSIFSNSSRSSCPARALQEDPPQQPQQQTENQRRDQEQERLGGGSRIHAAGGSDSLPAGEGLIEANLPKRAVARSDASMSSSQTGDRDKHGGHGSSDVRADIAPAVLSSLQQGGLKGPPAGAGLIEANLLKRGVTKRVLDLAADGGETGGMQGSPSASSLVMDGASMALHEGCVDRSSEENPSTNKELVKALASLDAYFDAATKASSDGALSDDALSRTGRMHSSGAYGASNNDLGWASLDGDESLKDDLYVGNNPLKRILWQEKPVDLTLPPVLFLHRHVDAFRSTFSRGVDNPSFPALLWFGLPLWLESLKDLNWPFALGVDWPDLVKSTSDTEANTKALKHLNWPFALGVDWPELVKSTSDTEANTKAFELYVALWVKTFTADDVAALVTVLSLSVQLQALSGLVTENQDEEDSNKALEKLSTALRHAERELHEGVLDPTNVWEKVLQRTSFVSDGRAFVYEDAIIFPGRLLSHSADDHLSDDPSYFLEKVQDCLDKDKVLSKKTALLFKSSTTKGHVHLVIAPWYWILSTNYDKPQLKLLFIVASVFFVGGFESAGLTLSSSGFQWASFAVPVGFSAVLASVVIVSNGQWPYFFPFSPLGAVGTFSSFPCTLPSRKSFLEALLNKSCASLAMSLLLIALGSTLSQSNPLHVVDLSGYVLAPCDLFSYSDVLTNLLNSMSVAMVMRDNGDALQAVNPFSLAGILGLNYTAFSLFPFWSSDGKLLLQNLLGNAKLANGVSLGLSLMMLVPLFFKNPFLGLMYVAYHSLFYARYTGCFAKDGVSEPNLLTKAIGFVLIASSIACVIPFPRI